MIPSSRYSPKKAQSPAATGLSAVERNNYEIIGEARPADKQKAPMNERLALAAYTACVHAIYGYLAGRCRRPNVCRDLPAEYQFTIVLEVTR